MTAIPVDALFGNQNTGSDDEESFPRGGGASILSDLEKKEIHQAAIAEFERY